MVVPKDLTQLKGGVDNTRKTLTGDKTSGNRVGVDVEATGESIQEIRTISGVGAKNPGDTDGHPVGEVLAVLLALAGQPEGLDDGLDGAQDAHADGEDAAGLGDGQAGQGDGLGDGLPGCDGRGQEGALGSDLLGYVRIPHAGVSRHEEYEDTGGEEDCNKGAEPLGVELQVGRGAEEEADAKVADQGVGDIGGSSGDVTGCEVDSLGLGDAEAGVLGDTTEDELGGLGGGGVGRAVSDGGSVDTEEGEDETEETGEETKAGVHLEAHVADDHGDGGHDGGSDNPDPAGDLLVLGSKVLNKVGHAGKLGGLLLKKGVVLALGLEARVDACSGLAQGVHETSGNDAELQDEFDQAVDDEDHDTGPEEPVARRGDPVFLLDDHGAEAGLLLPDGAGILGVSCTNSLAVLDQQRADESPGKHCAEEPGEGSVETDEDTGTEEGGVVNVQGPVRVSTPDVEPVEDVPVVEDAIGVLRDDDVDEGADEGVAESLDLLDGVAGTAADSVHGANGHGRGDGGGEDQVELTGGVDDEELSEGHGGEETEETADEGHGQGAAKVLLGVVGEQTELVHGRQTGDEHAGETTGTTGGGLDDGIFLGTEGLAEIGDVREDLAEEDNETISVKRSARAKLSNGKDAAMPYPKMAPNMLALKVKPVFKPIPESPGFRLTEIDIGGVDKRSETDTNEDGTDGQRVLLGLSTLDGREADEEIGDLVGALLRVVRLGGNRGCLLVADDGRLLKTQAANGSKWAQMQSTRFSVRLPDHRGIKQIKYFLRRNLKAPRDNSGKLARFVRPGLRAMQCHAMSIILGGGESVRWPIGDTRGEIPLRFVYSIRKARTIEMGWPQPRGTFVVASTYLKGAAGVLPSPATTLEC
ncbi:unnamed protein product [Clonostachys rhizophaga]|uniref:Uncharacterized protein n=1 Tax=Clonostachys rhizophaga TaxID=160324 RepID=A0A9N9YSX5_9HYPO|nr:unnamed protein product [Clonostachys rhizophaga]